VTKASTATGESTSEVNRAGNRRGSSASACQRRKEHHGPRVSTLGLDACSRDRYELALQNWGPRHRSITCDIQHEPSETTAEGPWPLSAPFQRRLFMGGAASGPSLCAQVHRLKIQATPSSSVEIAGCREQDADRHRVNAAGLARLPSRRSRMPLGIAACTSLKPALAVSSTDNVPFRLRAALRHHCAYSLPKRYRSRISCQGPGHE
jgi:hypothetical protein